MQIDVELQKPFYYSVIPIIVMIGVVILILIYMFIKRDKKIPEKQKEIVDVDRIKSKYMKEIIAIENKYNNKEITLRKAYQDISLCVRTFVFETTGIKTQTFCLEEIKKVGLTSLYDLIKEYYEPEFSLKSKSDFNTSLNNAKAVINKWQ